MALSVSANQQALNEPVTRPTATRIIGFDLARALAFIGMVIVNFKLVMGASDAGPKWLVTLAGSLEGRAVATFVVLAGVGISLLSAKARASGDSGRIRQARVGLLKRAAFLFIFGLLYAPIWPPDILHFYGIYMIIAALLLTTSNQQLWIAAGGIMAAFLLMFAIFNYEQGWDFETLTYLDFWTFDGMVRHLFFNGFHPVFPWAAFVLIGMWLGRQNVGNPQIRGRIFWGSVSVAVFTELLSWGLIRASANPVWGISMEDARALFGTEMMPPLPLYLIAGGATAVAVIMLCLMVTDGKSMAGWLEPFVATGQVALTLYVAHIVIGMGLLDAFGLLWNQTLVFSVSAALIFSIASMIFATLWRRKFARGPLEWLMRAVTK